jgi:DNA-binding NarL/FixJ family response regulator
VELFALKEAIADAFEVLTEEETWVFNGVNEGLSYRTIARQLNASKSSVFRTKKRAVRKLQHALQNHPAVVMQLERLKPNV